MSDLFDVCDHDPLARFDAVVDQGHVGQQPPHGGKAAVDQSRLAVVFRRLGHVELVTDQRGSRDDDHIFV